MIIFFPQTVFQLWFVLSSSLWSQSNTSTLFWFFAQPLSAAPVSSRAPHHQNSSPDQPKLRNPPQFFHSYAPMHVSKLLHTAIITSVWYSFACIWQFMSLGHCVLDSGPFDHISSKKALLFSLSMSGYLPKVTSANGAQTQSQGIRIVHPLPSLTVKYVLYNPGCL